MHYPLQTTIPSRRLSRRDAAKSRRLSLSASRLSLTIHTGSLPMPFVGAITTFLRMASMQTSRFSTVGLALLFVAFYTATPALGQGTTVANTPNSVVGGAASVLGPLDPAQM